MPYYYTGKTLIVQLPRKKVPKNTKKERMRRWDTAGMSAASPAPRLSGSGQSHRTMPASRNPAPVTRKGAKYQPERSRFDRWAALYSYRSL